MDLDLSSLNGVVKSSTPGARKTLQVPAKGRDGKAPTAESGTAFETHPMPNGNDTEEDEEQTSATPIQDVDTNDAQATTGDDMQILEFHSHNPIISFRNKIYSCTWSDMVGTNMFFSQHDEAYPIEPLEATEHYDLIGTSRIKLVGHQAKLTPKQAGKKRGRPPNEDGRTAGVMQNEDSYQEVENAAPGRSLGEIRYTNPKVNADVKKQARFLERLMDIKRAKGETDNVRTFVNWQAKSANKQPKAQHDKDVLHAEIEQLNRRVVRGDADALSRLQEIYSQLDDETGAGQLSPSSLTILNQSTTNLNHPDTPDIERRDSEG